MSEKKYPEIEDKSMVAAEPAVAYPMTSYADAMAMIHTMHLSRADKEKVARRLTIEVSEPFIADAFERIDHLATLQKDWDGEGALPVSPRVLNNLRQVLMISDNTDWKHWAISPDSNATVGLQSSATRACISLGAREFSYFARINGRRLGDSHVDFTPEAFLRLMREIG